MADPAPPLQQKQKRLVTFSSSSEDESSSGSETEPESDDDDSLGGARDAIQSSNSSARDADTRRSASTAASPDATVQWERGLTETDKKKRGAARDLRRKLNQRAELNHRAFLVCGLAALRLQHRWARSLELQAKIVSCLPANLRPSVLDSEHQVPKFGGVSTTLAWLQRACMWINNRFELKPDGDAQQVDRVSTMAAFDRAFRQRQALGSQIVTMFVALCRGLGFAARLVCGLVPPHLRFHKSTHGATSAASSASAAASSDDSQRTSSEPIFGRIWAEVAVRLGTGNGAVDRWIAADPQTGVLGPAMGDAAQFAQGTQLCTLPLRASYNHPRRPSY